MKKFIPFLILMVIVVFALYFTLKDTNVFSTITGQASWQVKRVGADKFAEKLKSENKNDEIIIAVLDYGVDVNDKALAGRVLEGINTTGIGDKNDVSAENKHGTAVAIEIVKATKGLDNIKILPIKYATTKSEYNSYTAFVDAIDAAINNNVDILNFSGGLAIDKDTIQASSAMRLLEHKIQEAVEAGVTVVVSSGQDGTDTTSRFPPYMPEVITVTAVDKNNKVIKNAGIGKSIDVAVPGTTTSSATALTSAICAMCKLENMELTPAGIKQLLYDNAGDAGDEGYDIYYGEGIVNMNK